jgi:hypothetical protein
MKLTNADLRRYYHKANKRYFRNTLPKDLPILFVKPRIIGGLGVTRIGKGRLPLRIEINEKLRFTSDVVIMVIFHEMLHVQQPHSVGHGWHFNRRMRRLAENGAFDGVW